MLNDKAGSVDTHSSFVFTAPGITPIYNNNPGFRIVTFNTIKRLLTDYHQYYMDLVLTTRKFFTLMSPFYNVCQSY